MLLNPTENMEAIDLFFFLLRKPWLWSVINFDTLCQLDFHYIINFLISSHIDIIYHAFVYFRITSTMGRKRIPQVHHCWWGTSERISKCSGRFLFTLLDNLHYSGKYFRSLIIHFLCLILFKLARVMIVHAFCIPGNHFDKILA